MKIALYKGTRPGLPGLGNRAVRGWTHGPYSHCELIFSDGLAASASDADRGVRFKQIDFAPARWDLRDLPAHLERRARAWFVEHEGERYDRLGLAGFVLRPIEGERSSWFCSEACAAALCFTEPWRFDPNTLSAALASLTSMQPAQTGFEVGLKAV